MENPYKIKAKVWLYPGLGGWHFVNVDKKISEKIRAKYGKGMVKILARIGKTEWNTALFPESRSRAYLISIKKAVRQKEEILIGDEVKISFKVI